MGAQTHCLLGCSIFIKEAVLHQNSLSSSPTWLWSLLFVDLGMSVRAQNKFADALDGHHSAASPGSTMGKESMAMQLLRDVNLR